MGHCAGEILKRGMGRLTCCFCGRGKATPLVRSFVLSLGKVGDRGPDARRFRSEIIQCGNRIVIGLEDARKR